MSKRNPLDRWNPGIVDRKRWEANSDEKARVDLRKRIGWVPTNDSPSARSTRMHELAHTLFTPSVSPAEVCERADISMWDFQACEDGRVNEAALNEIPTAAEALENRNETLESIQSEKDPQRLLRGLIACRGYLPEEELRGFAVSAGVVDTYDTVRAILAKGARAKTKLKGMAATIEATRMLYRGEAPRSLPTAPTPTQVMKAEANKERVARHRGDKKAVKEAKAEQAADEKLRDAVRDATRAATDPSETEEGSPGGTPIGVPGDDEPIPLCQFTVERLPLRDRRRLRGEARRDKRVGALIARPDRLVTPYGGPAFEGSRERGNAARGTVLVDVSGSMSLDVEDVREIINHGAAEVWMYWGYWGNPGGGKLQLVAKGTACVDEQTLGNAKRGYANKIDTQCLYWLGFKPSPRVWISDGIVTDAHEHHTNAVCDACLSLARIGRITRYAKVLDYLRDREAPLDCDYHH